MMTAASLRSRRGNRSAAVAGRLRKLGFSEVFWKTKLDGLQVAALG